ncbi:MAG: tetratricopeptide repeat protein [Parachlamydiaceae bacterium]
MKRLRTKAGSILYLFLSFHSLSAGNFTLRDFYHAGLYDKVIQAYEEGCQSSLMIDRFTLAHSFFQIKKYQDVITLLENQELEQREKLLLALTYQQTKQYNLAITLLKDLPKTEQTSFDLAINYFLNQDHNKAKMLFKEILLSHSKLKGKAGCFLIRIYLDQKLYGEAKKLIEQLKKQQLPQENLGEITFLEGDLFYRQKNFNLAIAHFEQALPSKNVKLASWYQNTLYQLGWSYLMAAENEQEEQGPFYEKAEGCFSKLFDNNPEEKVLLSYLEALIRKGKCLGDEDAYRQANQLLLNTGSIATEKGKSQALLLQATAALQYQEREKRLADLLNIIDKTALGDYWFTRAMNEWDEGHEQKRNQKSLLSKKHFEKAVDYFRYSYDACHEERRLEALKYLAMSYFYQSMQDKMLEAIHWLEKGIASSSLNEDEDPLEFYYLKALVEHEMKERINLEQSCRTLEKGLEIYTKSFFADKARLLLAQLYYYHGNYASAEMHFAYLAQCFNDPDLAAQGYYGAALSAKAANKNDEIVKNYQKMVFESYPQSPLAAECYFSYYPYSEYLLGDRRAIKHLQKMKELFPESHYTLNAAYLLGLDLKRDRRNLQGKWVSKKNLIQAIEAFLQVETGFDMLALKKLIPEERWEYYIRLRYRSILERALANLTIALESVGAKREIFIEYASEVLKRTLVEFSQHHPYAQPIKEKEMFSSFEEECYYNLVKIYVMNKNDLLANTLFSEAKQRYDEANITKSYYLAKLYEERGLACVENERLEEALDCFKRACDAGTGNILNSHERLELMIEQALCYQKMNRLEEAMLLLSQVINCDLASSLRIKAMFFRAEIYEQQGKSHLAKRQLETIVAKGGDWAQKAKEKLENHYGFY